jgi:hypothetical protein
LLGKPSSSQANFWHRHRIVFGPCLPCGLFSCRIPVFVRWIPIPPPMPVVVNRPVVMPPPVLMPSVVAPAPAVQPPTTLPGPVVSVPSQLLPPAVLPAASIMTPEQFARVFKPLPGKYEVTLIHPGSKRPVTVCFTLPDGCPRVTAHHRDLIFDYGRQEVHVRFAIGGRVRVTTRGL